MRVAIYARVSTESQEARGTIGSQLEVLRKRVATEACGLHRIALRRARAEEFAPVRGPSGGLQKEAVCQEQS